MNIAIAHEHYASRGGAEIVADELADTFSAPIVTGYLEDESYSDHTVTELLSNSPVDMFRPLFKNSNVRNLFHAFAWETAPVLRDYDIIIQSGNGPLWYVPEDDQNIIKYNHSPPREAFDLFGTVSTAETWRSILSPAYLSKRLYLKAIRQLWTQRTSVVDLWVCNSELVKQRTKKYLGIPEEQLEVVYPPVKVDQYTPTDTDDGYYITVSRLDESKRIDTLIAAFERLDSTLKIAGDGPQRDKLEARAAGMDNIEFTGYVSEARKQSLVQNAKAFLFAAENEDFGMCVVESMAAGTPVLGVDDGFTQYLIKSGYNGALFDRSPRAVARCVELFEKHGVKWNAEQLHRYSTHFSVDRFNREMREVVEKASGTSSVTVEPPTEVIE